MTESKTCVNPACQVVFQRPATVGPAKWARAQFCGTACASAARRQPTRPKPRKPLLVDAPSPELRYVEVDGQTVWRPSSPGWPNVVGGRAS